MERQNYITTNSETNIRRKNWASFVHHKNGNKKNDRAILSIHFNNFENIKKLIDYLQQEENQNFDIIIIENSTKEEEEKKLQEYLTQKEKITIIKPIQNIGSAGGYCLGMEYSIEQIYKYIFIVEDDIILLEKNTFSKLIESSNQETITFINSCKNTRPTTITKEKGKSRWVQIAGYPINFIKKIGTIDPRYFFRGEDLEWGSRIERGIKRFGYKTKVIDHNYLHPYLKSVNGNYTRFYFSIRNQLLSLRKQPIKNSIFLITLFFYLRTGLSKLLIKKDTLIIKALYNAITDFLKNNFSRENNKQKIHTFLNYNKKEEKTETINKKDLYQLSKNLYSHEKMLCITGSDRESIAFSKKIENIRKHGIIISSSSTIFYPITLLAPKIICINEFNLNENTVIISNYNNKNPRSNLLGIITTFIASLGIISIIVAIIIIYIIFTYQRKRKG